MIVACATLSVTFPDQAEAQAPGSFAIEGHVFNAKNGRPLPGVIVSYAASLVNDIVISGATPTDDNGFYEMEFTPPTGATTLEFFAVCRTKRHGDVRYYGRFYSTPRLEVYRRDFYITLPRGVSTCEVPLPG
jgi:hypothetical protein